MLNITQDNGYQATFVLEGGSRGSIHTDGEGTLYTTEECLLHPSRNPDLSKEQLEQYLIDYLGIEKVIWLTHGLCNDENNGHVDNIMHIVKPGERLTSSYSNFLISNGQIIFPLLDKQKDHKAKTILEQAFPNYNVIGVEAREILLGGGNIHCITQQIPTI